MNIYVFTTRFIRDTQVLTVPLDMRKEEFDKLEDYDFNTEDSNEGFDWIDVYDGQLFLDIIKAKSEKEAIDIISNRHDIAKPLLTIHKYLI